MTNVQIDRYEQNIKNVKSHLLGVIAVIFASMSFFGLSTIFAPLGLFFAAWSQLIGGKSAWTLAGYIIAGFATFFVFMQVIGGGFLLAQ
ncbi:MAG: hypothetical protein ACQESH_08860 [Campylobacterota bacterium]